eukprot:GHVN01041674.1.p1 GENE.GHVN01041674.1~~GHVN01041674.1.p1  ORF type:complete len:454 (-),score=78.53 GHVN01041674.1:548-1909(-)
MWNEVMRGGSISSPVGLNGVDGISASLYRCANESKRAIAELDKLAVACKVESVPVPCRSAIASITSRLPASISSDVIMGVAEEDRQTFLNDTLTRLNTTVTACRDAAVGLAALVKVYPHPVATGGKNSSSSVSMLHQAVELNRLRQRAIKHAEWVERAKLDMFQLLPMVSETAHTYFNVHRNEDIPNMHTIHLTILSAVSLLSSSTSPTRGGYSSSPSYRLSADPFASELASPASLGLSPAPSSPSAPLRPAKIRRSIPLDHTMEAASFCNTPVAMGIVASALTGEETQRWVGHTVTFTFTSSSSSGAVTPSSFSQPLPAANDHEATPEHIVLSLPTTLKGPALERVLTRMKCEVSVSKPKALSFIRGAKQVAKGSFKLEGLQHRCEVRDTFILIIFLSSFPWFTQQITPHSPQSRRLHLLVVSLSHPVQDCLSFDFCRRKRVPYRDCSRHHC